MNNEVDRQYIDYTRSHRVVFAILYALVAVLVLVLLLWAVSAKAACGDGTGGSVDLQMNTHIYTPKVIGGKVMGLVGYPSGVPLATVKEVVWNSNRVGWDTANSVSIARGPVNKTAPYVTVFSAPTNDKEGTWSVVLTDGKKVYFDLRALYCKSTANKNPQTNASKTGVSYGVYRTPKITFCPQQGRATIDFGSNVFVGLHAQAMMPIHSDKTVYSVHWHSAIANWGDGVKAIIARNSAGEWFGTIVGMPASEDAGIFALSRPGAKFWFDAAKWQVATTANCGSAEQWFHYKP